MGALRIGVAGWDYPDWKGIVYPAQASGDFDKLAHLSRFVDVLEIDSSFYRPATARAAESWVRRVADRPGFAFTAKAYRGITHEAPDDLGAEAVQSVQGLVPLREAGRLGALLLQYPQSFHRTAAAFDRLRTTIEALAGWPLVVEVRHASWNDEAAQWIREAGAGWCVVDQPQVGRSTVGPVARVTARIGYLRLHGRNAANWFREGAGRDARYDYLYSLDELKPLLLTAEEVARAAAETFVVQNNHFRGQAVVNALQLKHLVARARVPAPQSLVDAFPQLSEIVTVVDPAARLF